MVHIRNRLIGTMSVLVVFLLVTLCGGQSQHTGPPQSVTVMVGDDIVLPCQLEPPVDAVSITAEWGRPDLNPRFVYVWHDGQELLVDQNEAYKGRTSLSINKLKHGDLSLTLSEVKISDNGTYRCFIPKLNKEYFVELLVGAVYTPGISLAGIDKANSGVMLDCRSEGWYPEPEVLWLDGEGHVLSAGPTETVRGPDGLYTVSSRVTVEKRHSNNFTCRVQEKNINQTRETQIKISGDFFMTPSNCTPGIVTSVLFGLMFILAVVILVWTQRQNKTERKKREKETTTCNDATELPLVKGEDSREQFMAEIKRKEELEKMKQKLNEVCQMTEEEQKHMTQVIETLTELTEGLERQKEQLTVQMKEAERLAEENEKKVQSVEKEVTEKEGDKTANKAQGYFKLKEILTEIIWSLHERKKEHQEVQLNADKLMKSTMDEVKKIEEMRDKLENKMQQIKKQMEETEKTENRGNRKTQQIL